MNFLDTPRLAHCERDRERCVAHCMETIIVAGLSEEEIADRAVQIGLEYVELYGESDIDDFRWRTELRFRDEDGNILFDGRCMTSDAFMNELMNRASAESAGPA